MKTTKPKAKEDTVDLTTPFDLTRRPAAADIIKYNISKFLCPKQAIAIRHLCGGEEGAAYIEKWEELIRIFANMPYSYQQSGGKDNDPIVYAHFFRGGMDYWLCEKDVDTDDEGQIQAWGLVHHVGNCPEAGYFSMKELQAHGFEVDLHWKPERMSVVKAKCGV